MNERTNERKIVITSDGEETIAKMYEGAKVIKSATVTCDLRDFCFEAGAKKALKHLVKISNCRLDFYGENMGTMGNPTNYTDVVGRPLRVGDVVELFDDKGCSYGDSLIVQSGAPGKIVTFVMGIKCDCDDNDGTTGKWKILKKRSHEDVSDGEIISEVEYIKR